MAGSKRLGRHTILGVGLIAGLAALVVTGGAAWGFAEAHRATGPKIFIADHDPYVIDQAPAATGPMDLSAGDVALFDEAVETPDSGNRLGTAITRVQVVDAMGQSDANFILDCSIHLADGDLLFSGAELLSHLGTVATFPVVGGTGKYAGVSGQVKLTPKTLAGATGTLAVFDLRGQG